MTLLHKYSELEMNLRDLEGKLAHERRWKVIPAKQPIQREEIKREELDDDAIETGLRALAFRVGSSDGVPSVSDHVWERGCLRHDYDRDDYDVKIVQSDYPSLTRKLIVALMEESDLDLLGCGLMLAGNIFCHQLVSRDV